MKISGSVVKNIAPIHANLDHDASPGKDVVRRKLAALVGGGEVLQDRRRVAGQEVLDGYPAALRLVEADLLLLLPYPFLGCR